MLLKKRSVHRRPVRVRISSCGSWVSDLSGQTDLSGQADLSGHSPFRWGSPHRLESTHMGYPSGDARIEDWGIGDNVCQKVQRKAQTQNRKPGNATQGRKPGASTQGRKPGASTQGRKKSRPPKPRPPGCGGRVPTSCLRAHSQPPAGPGDLITNRTPSKETRIVHETPLTQHGLS